MITLVGLLILFLWVASIDTRLKRIERRLED